MQQTTKNRHIERQPYIQPHVFIPLWYVWQTNKKTQQERLLWAYANELDSAIEYLIAEIDRLNNNLQQHLN